MLIQLPLLALCGFVLADHSQAVKSTMFKFDPSGAVSLVLATGWFLFWMLPLNLDSASTATAYRLLKALTIPVFIGVTATWAWRQLGPIWRGVMLLEGWAAATRLGWVYMISPEQLCANYLISDQQTVGRVLLSLSGAAALLGVFFGIFGTLRHPTRSE